MTTAQRCKELLADFHNGFDPTQIDSFDSQADGDEDERQLSAWRLASDPEQWKETELNEAGSPRFGGAMAPLAGSPPMFRIRARDSRGAIAASYRPFSDFAVQREFACAEERLGASLRCFVLEDREGQLHIGEDTGD